MSRDLVSLEVNCIATHAFVAAATKLRVFVALLLLQTPFCCFVAAATKLQIGVCSFVAATNVAL